MLAIEGIFFTHYEITSIPCITRQAIDLLVIFFPIQKHNSGIRILETEKLVL